MASTDSAAIFDIISTYLGLSSSQESNLSKKLPDVGPALYKCYTNVVCSLGTQKSTERSTKLGVKNWNDWSDRRGISIDLRTMDVITLAT